MTATTTTTRTRTPAPTRTLRATAATGAAVLAALALTACSTPEPTDPPWGPDPATSVAMISALTEPGSAEREAAARIVLVGSEYDNPWYAQRWTEQLAAGLTLGLHAEMTDPDTLVLHLPAYARSFEVSPVLPPGGTLDEEPELDDVHVDWPPGTDRSVGPAPVDGLVVYARSGDASPEPTTATITGLAGVWDLPEGTPLLVRSHSPYNVADVPYWEASAAAWHAATPAATTPAPEEATQ